MALKGEQSGPMEQNFHRPLREVYCQESAAKKGYGSVDPVVIPALAPSLHADDRTLCLVRALCYYLKATEDRREGKELLFVFLNKGQMTNIEIIQLCYAAVDPATLQTFQMKDRDVRAFAASSAFYGVVSVEQILTACHWLSHTFTSFYLQELGPICSG